jgi:hypothetical protein
MIQTTLYFHSSKEDNYYTGMDLGLIGEALHRFRYAGYEISVGVEVNPETGETFATSFAGLPLPGKVQI